MKTRSVNWLSLFTLLLSVGAMFIAIDWPRKMALFPLTIGAALLALSAGDLILSLFRVKQNGETARVDFGLSREIEPGVRTRRTLEVFAWMITFFLLIVVFGFLVSVPVFMFLCLRFLGREPWRLSFALGLISWGGFYVLFDRLLHLPLPQPWVSLIP